MKHFRSCDDQTTTAPLVCHQRRDFSDSATCRSRATKTPSVQRVSRIASCGASILPKSSDATGIFAVIATTHFRIGVAKIFVTKCDTDSNACRLEAVTQGSQRQSNRGDAAIECLRVSEGRVSSSGARTSLAAKQILASHRAHRQDGIGITCRLSDGCCL